MDPLLHTRAHYRPLRPHSYVEGLGNRHGCRRWYAQAAAEKQQYQCQRAGDTYLAADSFHCLVILAYDRQGAHVAAHRPICAPTEIRTPVLGLKGPRPGPLDDGGLLARAAFYHV